MVTIPLKHLSTAIFFFLWFLANGVRVYGAEIPPLTQEPMRVVESYLRAIYARDFVEAYRMISSVDRKVRDLNKYVQQRGPFNGFTLELGRKLSDAVEITTVQRQETKDRIRLVIRYKVPDPKKLAPLLLNWDQFRLNSLSAGERKQLSGSIDRKKSDGLLEMSEGEETFELLKEGNDWR
ncbi:MAG TPA: hypothetical protein VNT76_15380, partial [Candidatus Binatus sp.]|nr:hypothetical protein [Candidatus Binatus sp.]